MHGESVLILDWYIQLSFKLDKIKVSGRCKSCINCTYFTLAGWLCYSSFFRALCCFFEILVCDIFCCNFQFILRCIFEVTDCNRTVITLNHKRTIWFFIIKSSSAGWSAHDDVLMHGDAIDLYINEFC